MRSDENSTKFSDGNAQESTIKIAICEEEFGNIEICRGDDDFSREKISLAKLGKSLTNLMLGLVRTWARIAEIQGN